MSTPRRPQQKQRPEGRPLAFAKPAVYLPARGFPLNERLAFMSTTIKLMLIAGGGALGALLRYGVSGVALRLLGAGFPWGTLCANLLGCFLIGLLWVLAERVAFHPHVNPFLFTGVLGAFTTFSTYSLESINLLQDGEVLRGVLNIAVSNGLGLVAVVAGFVCAQLLIGSSY